MWRFLQAAFGDGASWFSHRALTTRARWRGQGMIGAVHATHRRNGLGAGRMPD
jgi:hypothetical protein